MLLHRLMEKCAMCCCVDKSVITNLADPEHSLFKICTKCVRLSPHNLDSLLSSDNSLILLHLAS